MSNIFQGIRFNESKPTLTGSWYTLKNVVSLYGATGLEFQSWHLTYI